MKRFLKRFLVVLLVLIVVAQLPFIYRRYQTGQLAAKIAQAETERQGAVNSGFREYKGIIHAHTALGGHSTGSFEEIIAAANSNDLDFVLMTEHMTEAYDSSAVTLNGLFGKTLFIGGNELDTTDGDRFLLIPGGGEAAKARMQGTQAFLETAKRENKLAFVTYPERLRSWDAQFDGIEVFSLHTAAKQMNPLTAIGDLLWTYPSYPELMLAKGWRRPDLAKFDEISAKRPISMFAGTDAHSNIGFHILGDDAGNKLVDIKLDPYETIFRMARIHVLLGNDKPFDRETLIDALRAGRFFVGFDVLGDTTGFEMTLVSNGIPISETTAVYTEGLTLSARTPHPSSVARFVVYCNGEAVFDSKEQYSAEISYSLQKPGAYRVEVYRDWLGEPFDKMPWIMSNPVYVR